MPHLAEQPAPYPLTFPAFPEAAGKTVLTVKELAGEEGDIADPAMQDEEVFVRCRDEITRCLARGIERLLTA